ncbi:hypothetical protein L1049_010518 [Liquidambar formosana]|uniref:Endopeptidase S2P n=1 Tax=Liquidambar formosana TaxID=63359 RepID=A0AAP0R4G6_LIQFO
MSWALEGGDMMNSSAVSQIKFRESEGERSHHSSRRVMEGRRGRRLSQTLLPLHARRLSNTISCWYCDFKISAFNQPIFRFGRRHVRCWRVWFSTGIGFSVTALLGVTMICAWESLIALHLLNGSNKWSHFLFGFSPWVSRLGISLADAGYICISSFISVSVHELGHAVAAASEGIQMEYIAVFIAVLFPGALVAFNFEMLQALPRLTALRIYCAGIWHNAVCCAVCGLALFLLPLFLFPLYIYGESPMVLDVSSTSPLSGYLSRGDVIVSLDGIRVHNVQEWMEMTTLIDEQTLQFSNGSGDHQRFMEINGRKGYCVPSSLMEESKNIQLINSQSACPNKLTAFVIVSCFDPRMLDNGSSEDDHHKQRESRYCLEAKEIVKLKKCGDGWVTTVTNRSSCICSQDESCLTPVLMPDLIWVEITYSSPYLQECLQLGRNPSLVSETHESGEIKCGGTFVYVGDVISLAHSVQLTAYQPRWAFSFGANLPNVLEKILMWTFHVSLTLALLNSLPVYFLDGESILEVSLCYFTSLRPRKRKRVLQVCLLGGTIISMLTFLRIFISNFV